MIKLSSYCSYSIGWELPYWACLKFLTCNFWEKPNGVVGYLVICNSNQKTCLKQTNLAAYWELFRFIPFPCASSYGCRTILFMKIAYCFKFNPPVLNIKFSSVQSLSCVWLFQPHGLQHARLPCPSPTPGACSNSCLLNQWCHPTISSFVVPFSSCLQSFPASGSFLMSQLFASCGQTIGASASASVLPMNIQHWFPLRLTGLLAVQGTLKSLLQHHNSKASILQHSLFFMVQLSHPYMTTGKTIDLAMRTFVGKVMSLLSNMLSRLVIAFLPRSKCLLISWLQSPSAVILEPKKSLSLFHCFPIYLAWSDGTRYVFLNVEF